jgi:uncharacterized protein
VLWRPRDDDVVAAELGIGVAQLNDAVARARARLFDAREPRIRPGTDDKILASWNGLAISGLVEAGRVFGRQDLVDAAAGAGRFIMTELRDDAGRLLRSWREGRTSGPGFLDDYALVSSAMLDLYETTFDEAWFVEASRLVDEAIRLFADPSGAGFFDTGSDAERLVTRPKDLFDNAVPSGNSVMTEVLLRLAAFTGDASLEERAWSMLRTLGPVMAQAPGGFGHLLGALDLALARPKEIAVSASDPMGEDAGRMAQTVWRRHPPNRVLAVGRTEDTVVPLLRERPAKDGRATAYVCERFVCAAPVTDPEALARGIA